MKKHFCKFSFLLLLIMIFCAALCCFTTSAFLTKSIVSGNNRIQSANYDLDITVMQGDQIINLDGNPLPAGEYTIHFQTKTNSSAHEGFCLIKLNDKTYYTPPIEDQKSYSCTIQLTQDTTIAFETNWGDVNNASNYSNEWQLLSFNPPTTSTSDVNSNN